MIIACNLYTDNPQLDYVPDHYLKRDSIFMLNYDGDRVMIQDVIEASHQIGIDGTDIILKVIELDGMRPIVGDRLSSQDGKIVLYVNAKLK